MTMHILSQTDLRLTGCHNHLSVRRKFLEPKGHDRRSAPEEAAPW